MGRTIAIVGGSSLTNELANDVSPDVEVWGLNSIHNWLRVPASRWFQLHPLDWRENGLPYGRTPVHYQWLKTCGIPVYMNYPDPDIPTAVKYPVNAVVDRFGYFLVGTPAYMLALALHEGDVESIEMYGVDLCGDPVEYIKQRPSLAYFIGLARGMGVEVIMPPNSPLLKAPLYAIDEWPDLTPPSVRALGVA